MFISLINKLSLFSSLLLIRSPLQKSWAPCRTAACTVTIPKFENLGPWTVQWPKDTPTNLDQKVFAAQVTTSMPLGAVLQILFDTKRRTEANAVGQADKFPNSLASKGALNWEKIRILTKADFASFTKISPAEIDDEFLGFFSLLTSYYILASDGNPIVGPKHLLPVMPRTDFVTQYTTFIEKKLQKQLSEKKTSLFDIVEKVSRQKLATQAFKLTPGITNRFPDQWTGKTGDTKAGTLAVEKFLNYLQGYDKATKKPLPKWIF
jgi:hypothetical protein